MTLVRMIARPMLSTIFIAGGLSSLKDPAPYADRAAPVLDKLMPLAESATSSLPVKLDAALLVRLNGVVHVAAGAMLATGKAPRLASLALAATLVPTTFGGHRFWEESEPAVRATQRMHFLKNVSLIGGLLIASVDTGGKPSLTWRAKHQAEQAKKRLRS